MTPTRLASIAFLALLVGVGSACSDDAPFELTYETENLRVGVADGRELCGGDLDRLERHVANVEELLATQLPGKVDVYLWPGQSESGPGDHCSNDRGCFYREISTIYAREGEVGHELVHAVAIPLGDPSAMWSEGLAEALDMRRTFVGSVAPSDNFFREEDVDYPSAGHFVRWVWATHGPQVVRDVLTDPREPLEAFEAITGQTLAEAEADYSNSAPYSFGQLAPCQHPQFVETEPGSWSGSIELDCANDDTFAAPMGLGGFRVLGLDERAEYRFHSDASALMIQRCPDEDVLVKPEGDDFEAQGEVPPSTSASPEGPVRVIDAQGEGETLELAAGRYELILLSEEARAVSATATRLP